MPENKIQLLSTKSLPVSLIREVSPRNIVIDAIPFIETEALQTIEVQQEIEQASIMSATVIFTSRNAAEAVIAGLEDHQPDWNIYCIGHATRETLVDYFGEDKIAGTADNAAGLAELIVEQDATGEALFFCGNKRLDELPDALRAQDIEVHEIMVYHTIAVPKKVSKKYNGILFFSPSAVDSFFKVNRIGDDTILFAIGNTTSNRIKKYSANKVIISKTPEKGKLINEAVSYFS